MAESSQSPPRARIQRHHGKPRLRELARQRAAARAGADDREIDLLVIAVFAHRHPAADAQRVGRTAVLAARGVQGVMQVD